MANKTKSKIKKTTPAIPFKKLLPREQFKVERWEDGTWYVSMYVRRMDMDAEGDGPTLAKAMKVFWRHHKQVERGDFDVDYFG